LALEVVKLVGDVRALHLLALVLFQLLGSFNHCFATEIDQTQVFLEVFLLCIDLRELQIERIIVGLLQLCLLEKQLFLQSVELLIDRLHILDLPLLHLDSQCETALKKLLCLLDLMCE
jgi:hypothetical protein